MSKTGEQMIDKMNQGNTPPKKRRAPRKKKPQGLGDVVEKVTEATGIKKVVKAIAGDDCGCEERKKKLNEAMPFIANKRMTERQRLIYETVIIPHNARTTELRGEAFAACRTLYNELGLGTFRVTGCPGCARKMQSKLRLIYEASCEES